MILDVKADIPVSRLMTRAPITLAPDDTARRAREVMLEHGVHHLPIVEGGRFVGLVSTNDLHRVALGDPFGEDPDVVAKDLELFDLRGIMIEDVATIERGATVRQAALRLTKGGFHALPVLDGDTLVGILTSTDLIAYLIDE